MSILLYEIKNHTNEKKKLGLVRNNKNDFKMEKYFFANSFEICFLYVLRKINKFNDFAQYSKACFVFLPL